MSSAAEIPTLTKTSDGGCSANRQRLQMNEDQGKTYSAFIEAQLKAENDLRASVTARANSALTGATGLVTLVLAVFAVFLGKRLHT